MIEPGFYEMRYAGLSLAECWRLGGGLRGFMIALRLKLRGERGAGMWIPASEFERPCSPDELTEETVQRLQPYVSRLAALGYGRGSHLTATRAVEGGTGGGYRALHDDGIRFLLVAFSRVDAPAAAGSRAMETLSLSGYLVLEDGATLTIANHSLFLDAGRQHRVVVLAGADLRTITSRLAKQAAGRDRALRRFRDLEDLDRARREIDHRVWEERLRRGLFSKAAPYS